MSKNIRTLVVSAATALRRAFAVPVATGATLGARRSRRVVSTGLLVAMLIPLLPFKQLHAETTDHGAHDPVPIEVAEEPETDVGDVPNIEANVEPSVNRAAAVQGGCPPYISGGPNNPDRGVRTFGFCVDVPVPYSFGTVSCEVCVCWYEMDDGRTERFSTTGGCSTTIRIFGPAPDPCNSLNEC